MNEFERGLERSFRLRSVRFGLERMFVHSDALETVFAALIFIKLK
jgi:hypothetical protein